MLVSIDHLTIKMNNSVVPQRQLLQKIFLCPNKIFYSEIKCIHNIQTAFPLKINDKKSVQKADKFQLREKQTHLPFPTVLEISQHSGCNRVFNLTADLSGANAHSEIAHCPHRAEMPALSTHLVIGDRFSIQGPGHRHLPVHLIDPKNSFGVLIHSLPRQAKLHSLCPFTSDDLHGRKQEMGHVVKSFKLILKPHKSFQSFN